MLLNSEIDILSSIEAAISGEKATKALSQTLRELKSRLEQDPESSVELEELQLEVFEGLPTEIRSCKLILIRAGTEFDTERHPNSHQRTISLNGQGVITLLDGSQQRPQQICSMGKSIPERWISIPTNRWHQPTAGNEDWTILTFQTADEDEIIDEYLEDQAEAC